MASALETLCGQAFGAKKHHMLGVYLQRSWVVLLIFAAALTPTYIFMEDLLLLIGQSPELSRLAGQMSMWLLPQHFAMAMLLPLTRFLQSQLKNWVTAATAAVALAIHVAVTYVLVQHLQLGIVGAVAAADMSWTRGGSSCWGSSSTSSAGGARCPGRASRWRRSPTSGSSLSSPRPPE